MKRVPFAAVLLLASCRPLAVAPEAGPADASLADATTATVVYLRLVEAGCLAEDDAGATAIEQEVTIGDPWLVCMMGGGSVQACHAPCE